MPSASLVVQTSFLGDVILTTPLLTELAGRGPVDVLVTPSGESVLRGHPAVRNVIVYDKRGDDRGIGGFRRLVRRVRSGEYGVAYLAQSSVRSAALAWLAGIPERVGLADSPGKRLFTASVPNRNDRHQAERLWRLAFPSGDAPETMPPPSLFPSEDDCAAVEAFVGSETRPLVVLAPGSAWQTKRWPYFEALAADLSHYAQIVVIGGPEDVLFGEIIRVRVPDVIIAAGELSLLGSAELIRRASVVVTNDSSPTHLASAMGTPTVTIYGPTTPGFGFGPLAPGSRVAQLEKLPCRPCHHHGPTRCPLGHWRCMVELRVEHVAEVVRQAQRGAA